MFFKTIYTDLLNTKKTKKAIEGALAAADACVAARAKRLFAAVLTYLREAGEIRSASDLESHFSARSGSAGSPRRVDIADQGLFQGVARACDQAQLGVVAGARFLPAGWPRCEVGPASARRLHRRRMACGRPSPCRARASTI